MPTVEDKEKKERVQGWAGGNGAFDFLFTLGTIETEMREDLWYWECADNKDRD